VTRPFKSELILEERIAEATFRAFHVGFDQNQFRLQPLVDIIRKVIPEFALGYHAGIQIPLTDMVERLKEAAETVYLTDKYKTRGEFGELILHLLLRDFCDSIPLVSKIYFKDSHNVPAHGFDGVHVTTSDRKLWLGESKLYLDGKQGVRNLADDLKKHVTADYLRREFALLSRKLPESIPEIEYWRDLMDKHKKLEDIYSGIVVPMVCTYSSPLFKSHSDNTPEYFQAFDAECRGLLAEFESSRIKTSCDVVLMTLPVPCKNELNTELDKRLKAMQNI
jgi:hypothetical protein